MSKHFVELCQYCESVISQCRCPSLDKTTTYGTCPSCARKSQEELAAIKANLLKLKAKIKEQADV